MSELDFVSIDFETLTPNLTSACSVGLVKVINGIISQKFYSLIKPIPDDYNQRNTFVHGITDEMVLNAPTFADLFPVLVSFVDNLPFVCHKKATDMNIIMRCMDYYALSGLHTENCIDTLDLYNKGLQECCDENGIVFTNHHDALSDAEACAKLYLCYNGCLCQDLAHYDLNEVLSGGSKRKYEHDTLLPLSDDEIENKDTLFYHKKVVITGVLSAYPDRDELGGILKKYGADVDTNISGKTNLVIIGNGAGPSKLKKIQDLQSQGKSVRLIYENELCTIMDEIIN